MITHFGKRNTNTEMSNIFFYLIFLGQSEYTVTYLWAPECTVSHKGLARPNIFKVLLLGNGKRFDKKPNIKSLGVCLINRFDATLVVVSLSVSKL